MNDLNEKQQEVVLHDKGPALVLAGPGSGKTKTLTHRVAHLINNGTHYSHILALTFTNKAANEMKYRVGQMMDNINPWDLNISTFHSFCLKMLKEYSSLIGFKLNFSIYDNSESLSIVKQLQKEFLDDPKEIPPKKILNYIEKVKHQGIYDKLPEDYDDYDQIMSKYFEPYEEELKKCNAMDFNSLINNTIKLLKQEKEVRELYRKKIKYIMVDEYQDTNKAQFMILSLLVNEDNNICLIGDFDQLLYSWRGADVENILSFEDTFKNTKVYRLEQNYRSTQSIIKGASALIKYNHYRKDKTLWTENNIGDPIRVLECNDHYGEAAFVFNEINSLLQNGVDPREIAVLFRNNHQSRIIEENLNSAGIPYILVGGLKFLERKEVKDILCYLRCLKNNDDIFALKRIINEPKRGIGNKTLENILSLAKQKNQNLLETLKDPDLKLSKKAQVEIESFNKMMDEALELEDDLIGLYDFILEESGYLPMLRNEESHEANARIDNLKELKDSLKEYNSLTDFLNNMTLDPPNSKDETPDQKGINLMTIHSSKGLEFTHVFIIGAEEEILPSKQSFLIKEKARGIEEERRLFFVAMTRAKKHLAITYARERVLFGQRVANDRSRFINEIPTEYLDVDFYYYDRW